MRSTSNGSNKWEMNHFHKDIYFSHCFPFCVCAGIKDMKVELSTVPQLGTVPPLAGRCGSGRRDLWAGKGVLSAVRLGRVIPRGGSSGSKKGKPTFFSLLRTRWNVMVWFQTSQGGGYPRGKNRRKWDKEGSGVKTQPRRASSSLVVSDCGWTCLRLQWVPSPRMSSNRESCGFTLALSPSPGSRRAEVKFEFPCLPLCWLLCGEIRGTSGLDRRLPELDPVGTAEVWTAASFSTLLPLLLVLLLLLCSFKHPRTAAKAPAGETVDPLKHFTAYFIKHCMFWGNISSAICLLACVNALYDAFNTGSHRLLFCP